MMVQETLLLPAVYKIVKEGGKYLCVKIEDFLVTPEKLYGDMGKHAEYFWNAYTRSDQSMGVLLTGASGSGKTVLTSVISNIGIMNNMPVIIVSEIQADINLIRYIDGLKNVTIVLDEFGKVFSLNLQDKALTMLSSGGADKKLFLITENNTHSVSKYILNRPGRVRYHIDYIRLDEKVFNEYCADFDIKPEFFKELKNKYESSPIFSFDHLSALVTEHQYNKDASFDELLTILNLGLLSKPKMLVLSAIYDMKEKKDIEFFSFTTELKHFNNGNFYWLRAKDIMGELKISTKSVIHMSDDSITCLSENRYKIILDIDDGSHSDYATDNINNPNFALRGINPNSDLQNMPIATF